jgi:hypothetical protein
MTYAESRPTLHIEPSDTDPGDRSFRYLSERRIFSDKYEGCGHVKYHSLRVQIMLITFKSSASADVMMFGDVAEKMMEILGKAPSEKGIVTVESLPAAIDKLKAAMNADIQISGQEKQGANDQNSVSIAQRAQPLVELFEWSLKQKVPVVWGV